MNIFGLVTLILVALIISALIYYILTEIIVKRRADKAYKDSIQKQVVEIESRKNKIRVFGDTEFEQTEFVEKKHAKR